MKNILVSMIVVFVSSSLVSASKLDSYRDMVKNREFTISYTYETEIPSLFISNPEIEYIEGKIYFDDYKKAVKYYNDRFCIPNMVQLTPEESLKNGNGVLYFTTANKNTINTHLRNASLPAGGSGMAAITKDNMYSECVTDKSSIHHLKLGDQYLGWKSYNLMSEKKSYTPIGESVTKDMMNSVPSINIFSIFGGNDNSLKLKYLPYDTEMELNYGINLGSTLITRYINAILPDEDHPVYIPKFNLVSSTPEYEDYQTDNNGKKEVVRYCFDGDKLTKIMVVIAGYKLDGTPNVHQYSILINDFTSQVDPKHFEIPEYIKIKK